MNLVIESLRGVRKQVSIQYARLSATLYLIEEADGVDSKQANAVRDAVNSLAAAMVSLETAIASLGGYGE